jgi:hypothetical protein
MMLGREAKSWKNMFFFTISAEEYVCKYRQSEKAQKQKNNNTLCVSC